MNLHQHFPLFPGQALNSVLEPYMLTYSSCHLLECHASPNSNMKLGIDPSCLPNLDILLMPKGLLMWDYGVVVQHNWNQIEKI